MADQPVDPTKIPATTAIVTAVQRVDPRNLNLHDLKVLGFHALVIGAQAALIYLGKENFGIYTSYVVLLIQLASEALRRIVV